MKAKTTETYQRRQRLAVVALGFIILFAVVMGLKSQPELDCYEEQVASMSIQEMSNLFDTALVELSWQPGTLQVTSQATIYPSYYANHPQYSECDITIVYPSTKGAPNFVSISSHEIGYIESTKMPAQCSWGFDRAGPTGSTCRVDVDGETSTVRLNMSFAPTFLPDVILDILDGLQVIEPTATE